MPRKPKGKQVRDESGRVLAVRGKAANGEGSVYAIEDGRRWRATWRDHGQLYTVTGSTREKVLARRAARMAEPRRATAGEFSSRTSVGELATWWLDTVARHRVRASTLPKYEDLVRRFGSLAGRPLADLGPDQVATWQSDQLNAGLAPKSVANARVILRQVLGQAVELGLIAANPVDRTKAPRLARSHARALSPEEARRLIAAAADDRLGAAIAILFVQGWRISEVLGLAWSDVDVENGTATIRRASVYVDGVGVVLGPPKTDGAEGVHHLAPGVVRALERRRAVQATERATAGDLWRRIDHDGRPVELVFTAQDGGLVPRQAITKLLKRAADAAGLDPATVSTHTGRRTVVTALYATEGVDLADIARHVGHSRTATTEGYVKDLGQRPRRTAEAAARVLDSP